jgi:hypothetical protein
MLIIGSGCADVSMPDADADEAHLDVGMPSGDEGEPGVAVSIDRR